MQGRDFLSINDVSSEELIELLELAHALKAVPPRRLLDVLPGAGLAMIFEKPSLRTRATFAAGMGRMGGFAIDLLNEHLQMGVRESVPDVARNLERWVSVIMARVFDHNTLVELADNARLPIINGLSDIEHPCQTLADLTTIREHKGSLRGCRIAFVGDGFNVAHSLMLGAAKLGVDFVFVGPESHFPQPEFVARARQDTAAVGGSLTLETDVRAVRGADVIYTDAWTSMGQEDEHAARVALFNAYQVNDALLEYAKPDAIVMHCLPAHRGEEITDDVLDGAQSVVFDEAENRMWAQMALVLRLLLPKDEVEALLRV